MAVIVPTAQTTQFKNPVNFPDKTCQGHEITQQVETWSYQLTANHSNAERPQVSQADANGEFTVSESNQFCTQWVCHRKIRRMPGGDFG